MTEALLIAGVLLLGLPIGVLWRTRDFFVRVHAPGMVQGLLLMLVAVALAGDAEARGKAAMIAAFLLLTTPISNHALARTHRAEERGRQEGD